MWQPNFNIWVLTQRETWKQRKAQLVGNKISEVSLNQRTNREEYGQVWINTRAWWISIKELLIELRLHNKGKYPTTVSVSRNQFHPRSISEQDPWHSALEPPETTGCSIQPEVNRNVQSRYLWSNNKCERNQEPMQVYSIPLLRGTTSIIEYKHQLRLLYLKLRATWANSTKL